MKLADAARRGRLDLVRAAKPDAVSMQSLLSTVTQDFKSIRKGAGHIELSQWLLAQGARATSEMVYQVARGGHADLAELLLHGHGTVDVHAAAAVGDADRVAALLASDPKLARAADHEGKQPLHCCAASALGAVDARVAEGLGAVAQALLGANAPPDAAVTCGGLTEVTPLMHVCWTGGDMKLFELLLAAGGQPTQRCLWAAVGHFQRHGAGHYNLAKRLLALGLDINANDGRTLLHAIAAHEDAVGVRWLLDHGADVHAVDAAGATSLHAAARRNRGVKVLQALMAAGADTHAVDAEGKRAIDHARDRNRIKAVQLLAAAATKPDT